MRRWPQWRLDDEHHGLYQADAGIADPNRANAAHQRLARAHGATLLEHAPVTRLRDAGGDDRGATLADGTVHRAGHVVLAADAWTNELLASFDRRLPLTIIQEQVTYFACPRPGGLRAGSLPDLDLDGRPVASTASRPTARRARRPPRTSAATETTPGRRGRSSAIEVALRPARRVPRTPPAGPPRARRSTRRPASTR